MGTLICVHVYAHEHVHTHVRETMGTCVYAHMCVYMHTLVPNKCAEIYCKELVTVDKEIGRSKICRANGQATNNNCYHSLRTEFVLQGLSI